MFPYVPVLAAGVAAFVFGAVWYMALGKTWQRALGRDPEACKGQKMPVAPLVISFLTSLLMAAALSQMLIGFGIYAAPLAGARVGFLVGLCFLVPANLVNNLYQQKKPMVTVIDGLHWLIAVTLEGAILGAMLT